MDDFLNALREPPRPEFANSLRQQLRAQERRRARKAAAARFAGLAASVLALVLAVNVGVFVRRGQQREVWTTRHEVHAAILTTALLLPGAQQAATPLNEVALVEANPPAEIDTMLRVPPTPVSHHH